MVIPQIDINKLHEIGRTISYDEGKILLREGDVAKNAYFIISGGIRLFFYAEEGEVTLEFFFEGSVVSSFSSFHRGKPSTFWLETIEKCELVELSREKLDKLFQDLPELHNIYTEALEVRLDDYIERLKTFLSLDAKKRYDELAERRPDVIQRVKQKYIASYIGIKPESLSRIRSH